MKETRYLIVYKDSANARTKYFGPFVTDVIADEFREKLPQPLTGGFKLLKALAPYSADEAQTAAHAIMIQRDPTSALFGGRHWPSPREISS